MAVEYLNPFDVRFSQSSAGGGGRANALRISMVKAGWLGDAVDGVRTPAGVVTIDNTRVAIAREVGIELIPVRVHETHDPLPAAMAGRFGDAVNWGEALVHRTGSRRPAVPATGSIIAPKMRVLME